MRIDNKMETPFVTLAVFIQVFFSSVWSLETEINVDCHTDHKNMLVTIETDEPFYGTVYVSNMRKDPKCLVHGRGNKTTLFKVPYKECNTTKKDEGLFMSRITVQQHQLIVSAGDGDYEVGCKMFAGDIQIGSERDMQVTVLPKDVSVATENILPPQVLLRIYDFENDNFVETVRLGQVVELEVTVKDGNLYKGRVSDCDAYGEDRTMFPVVRNYCPVDLSVSDKVYVDDQSRTTGDFYLYIPFRVFRFLDGARVAFTCNVIICQDDCPEADCGDFVGMSYGRKRRSAGKALYSMTVSNEVTVVGNSHSKLHLEEKEPIMYQTANSNVSIPWFVGGTALLLSFLISITINIYLLLAQRRMRRSSSSCSCHQMSARMKPVKETELIYPSLPLRR